MSYRRFPPLNAVRAFVAAARHLSFTLAAAELGVTHGAVSRQIKQLEQYLGVCLFERRIRHITLTPAGHELFSGMAPAIEQIAATADAVAKTTPNRVLRINVRASFAARWLIPKLPEFIREHPDVMPQIITSATEPERLNRDGFDIVIRRTATGWPVDFKPKPFLSDRAYLVAAPSLIKRCPVQRIDDLRGHVFLHSETRASDWSAWLRFVKQEFLVPSGEMYFDHLDFALRAASDGLGIAISPASLVASDITEGRLCHVLPEIVRPIDPYLIASQNPAHVAAKAFMDWILSDSVSSEQDF